MRCVTYNIQHGARGLDQVGDALARLKPDVVFLQEVDCGCARSGRLDQARELGKRLGLSAIFGQAFAYDGGSYGLALLAREPLTGQRIYPLPHPSPRMDDGTGEPRIALVGRFRDITLVCTHLGLSDSERVEQARTIHQTLQGTPRLVLGGDMNEGPGGPVAASWDGWLTDAYQEAGGAEGSTAPTDRPDVRIDHIFRSVDAPVPRKAFIDVAEASDHQPVVIDFI